MTGLKKARRFRAIGDETPVAVVRKEEAPCCNAKRDRDGRLPIGYCGPACVRREIDRILRGDDG